MFESLIDGLLALADGFFKSLPESPIMGIHKDLLPGFCILKDNEANIGQLHFTRIPQPDTQDLVVLVKQPERALPTGAADKIRDQKDQRPPFDGS
jgi:hypothetical protein